MPHSSELFAFQLCPPQPRPEAARRNADGTALSQLPSFGDGTDGEGAREAAATDSFVLLAESEESRREWMKQIGALLQRS